MFAFTRSCGFRALGLCVLALAGCGQDPGLLTGGDENSGEHSTPKTTPQQVGKTGSGPALETNGESRGDADAAGEDLVKAGTVKLNGGGGDDLFFTIDQCKSKGYDTVSAANCPQSNYAFAFAADPEACGGTCACTPGRHYRSSSCTDDPTCGQYARNNAATGTCECTSGDHVDHSDPYRCTGRNKTVQAMGCTSKGAGFYCGERAGCKGQIFGLEGSLGCDAQMVCCASAYQGDTPAGGTQNPAPVEVEPHHDQATHQSAAPADDGDTDGATCHVSFSNGSAPGHVCAGGCPGTRCLGWDNGKPCCS